MQVKKGVCEWLAWILRIERPGHKYRNHCFGGKAVDDAESNDSNRAKLLASNNEQMTPSLQKKPTEHELDLLKQRVSCCNSQWCVVYLHCIIASNVLSTCPIANSMLFTCTIANSVLSTHAIANSLLST